MSLRREVGLGLFWVAVANLGARGLSLFRDLILARLLLPHDFGLVGYALLVIGMLELFKELGFSSALIYRRDNIREAANTAFVAIVLSSVLLYGVAWLAAPMAASFFRNETLVPILRALSLTLVISAVGQVPLSLMARGMGFKKRAIPEMIASLTASVLSVVLALLGYGVWSIVYGQIVMAVTMSVLVWFFCPWRPTLDFSKNVALELWDYGKHIIGSQIMVFFITHVDDAFVGRFLGDAAYGAYGLAYKLSNLPATHLSRVVGRVMFPAFSRVQEDTARLRQVFFRSIKYVSLAAFPIAVITLVFAKDFMIVAYGRKWASAVIPLQWLTVYGLARSIAVNMGNVFKAGGKPKWLFRIATLRLIVMVVFIYPAILYDGIIGVSILSAIVAVIDFFVSLFMTNRIIRAPWRSYARILLPMLLTSVLAALLGHQAYRWIGTSIHPFVSLPLTGALALGIYLLIMYLYDPDIRLVAAQAVRGVASEFRQRPAIQRRTSA